MDTRKLEILKNDKYTMLSLAEPGQGGEVITRIETATIHAEPLREVVRRFNATADNEGVYSILITYPDHGSWFGEGRGDTVEEAIADARRQIREDNGFDGELAEWDDDELEVLLVVAGEHQDLKP